MDSTATYRSTKITYTDSIHLVGNQPNISKEIRIDSIIISKFNKENQPIDTRDIISLTVWPVVLIFTILLFRQQIAKLIEKIKDISIGKEGFHIVTFNMPSSPETSVSLVFNNSDIDNILNNYSAKRVLSTFWSKQKRIKDKNYRYSFIILSSSKEYPEFIEAILELKKYGLVEQDVLTLQYYLTNSGYDFCVSHEADLKAKIFQI